MLGNEQSAAEGEIASECKRVCVCASGSVGRSRASWEDWGFVEVPIRLSAASQENHFADRTVVALDALSASCSWLCRLMDSVFQDGQGEEDDEDGASEAASLEEPKEEDQGEGYLSEMDNEPPVSESDDGFSVHNAPLQSHALADSIPSSPASSQL